MSDIFRDWSFGGYLRDKRVEKKLTLREAAIKLDMDAGNLSKIERSELNPPKTSSQIKRIVERLGLDSFDENFLNGASFNFWLGQLKKEFHQ